MKKQLWCFSFCFSFIFSFSQPWLAPLKICTGTNGTSFSGTSVFQDSSGVATVIRIGSSNSDTLLAAFQWFPMPMNNPQWDKVAIKYSYNGGTTWTTPTTCTFVGLPGNFQRPFDPALVKMPNGKIRMYFSCGPQMGSAGSINTYAGMSDEGTTYTFEPMATFDDATKNAIDPAVGELAGTFYYNSSTGVQNDPSHRGISANGISFTTQAVFPFDGTHVWLGNYLTDGSTLKFYGCGSSIWVNSTNDGTIWNGYTNTNVGLGADPAVVKNKSGTYIMIFTGAPNPTGIEEKEPDEPDFLVYPIIFHETIRIKSKSGICTGVEIFDQLGKLVLAKKEISLAETEDIRLEHLGPGIYHIKLSGFKTIVIKKIIKTE